MSKSAFNAIREGLAEAIAYAEGDHSKGKASVHDASEIDVAAIRKTLGLSQAKFCATFGITKATLTKWEQGQRKPTGPARVLMKVIERHPDAVRDVVAA